MGIPKNPQKKEIPKMENCSAPKWGCKNPQLVDLPKSRYPIVHLTSLTENANADAASLQPHAAPRTPVAPRHLRCMGQCAYRRTMLRKGVAPHARTPMHMPHHLCRHALTQTDERHSDTDEHPFFILFSTAGGWGSLSQARTPRRRQAPSGGTRSGRDTVAGQDTVAMQRTVAMPDTVAAGAIRLSR